MKKKHFFIIALFCVISSIHNQLFAQVLKVDAEFQTQTNWCWAATSKCVINYYGGAASQCAIVEYTRNTFLPRFNYGSVNCCSNPGLGCNQPNLIYNWLWTGTIHDVLDYFQNIQSNGINNFLTTSEIQNEISNDRLFIIGWQWTGPNGGGHVVVGHGILGNTIYYMNPGEGYGYEFDDYDWMKNGADPGYYSHNWIQTLKLSSTNPPPSHSCADNFESNNSGYIATPVFSQALTGSADYTPIGTNIGFSGDQDWFRIDLNTPGNLEINLTNLPFDYDLYLYSDASGTNSLSNSVKLLARDETVSFTNTSSSLVHWYAKVSAKNGTNYWTRSCYKIQFKYTPNTTCTIAGITPTITSPGTNSSPGQLITGNTPTLTWNALSGATNYGVYIRNMNTNTLVVNNDCASSGTSFSVPTSILSNNVLYSWNIKANIGCGICLSNFSNPLYFRIQPSSSCVISGLTPTLISPGASSYPGQSITTLTPILTWNTLVGATSYGVYVRDLLTNNLVLDSNCASTGTSFTVPIGRLTNGRQYRWNIIARIGCSDSCVSYYASALYFQVQTTNCALTNVIPILSSPGTNSTPGQMFSTTTPTFSWNAVPGANNYGVFIRDLSTNTIVVNQPCGIMGTSYNIPSSILISGRNYKWSIRASDTCGVCVSDSSLPLFFNINSNCSFTFSSHSISFGSHGGSNSFGITTTFGCNWTAVTNASWISFNNQSGTGSGNVVYTVANNSGSSRFGYIILQGDTFTISQAGSGNKAILGYEYWYDESGTRNFVPISAIGTYTLNANLPTPNLQQGLHSLHLRFIDNAGNWGSVLSEYFQKVAIDTGNYNKVTSYEYWYDTQDNTRNLTSVTPQQTFELNQNLQTDNLQQGLHSLHVRFKNGGGVWSSVLSEYFQKVSIDTGNYNKVTAYEYWYDINDNARNLTSVSPIQTFYLNDNLQTDSLQQGLHSLHVRFKSDGGVWSSVLSEYFQKVSIDTGNYNKITAYEYWYDTKDNARNLTSVSPIQTYYLNDNLQTDSLQQGLHSLHVRFKNGGSAWSSVLSEYFQKVSVDTGNYNMLTKYEYWYDTAASSRFAVNILPVVQQLFLDTGLNAQGLSKGSHQLHTRFAAGNSLWSSVTTDTFDKKGLFLVDSIIAPSCANDSLKIRFVKWATYNTGNLFTVQLSDSSGSFSAPNVIGSKTNTTGGLDSILCFLPVTLKYSTHYKIRAVCTNIADTSPVSNEFTINLVPTAIITASGAITFCIGNNVTFNANTGAGLSYQWNNNNILISGATNSGYLASASGNYTVLVTNANGCKKLSGATSIIVNPKPNVGFTINNAIQCVNGNSFTFSDTSTIGGGTLTRTWNFGDLTTATNNPAIKTYNTANTYFVKLVSTSNNGCKDSTTKTVIVNPKPNAGFTINTATQCLNGNNFLFNDTSTIGSGTYIRLWNLGGGDTSTIVNANKTFTGSGVYNIKLVLTSNNSCKDSIIKTVTINPSPTPAIFGLNVVCANSTSVYSTPNNTGRTYLWAITGGSIVSGQGTSSITVTWGAAGSGILVVSDSVNTTGCKTTTTEFNVTKNPNPTPAISGLNSVCAGSSISYSTPSNTGRTYLWIITGGSITSGQGTASVTVNWGVAGPGTLVVSDSVNTTGCKTITSQYSVTINANPAPAISGSSSVCANSTTVYTTPNNTGRTYMWTVTGGSITSGQGTANVTVNWGSAGTGTLVVSDSVNATGCKTITSPYSVTINSNPAPVISGSNSVCANSTFVYSTPNNTGRTYVWTVTSGSITSGQGTASVTVNWGVAGSGTLVVSDSVNATGCKTITSPYSVTINANPTPVISGSNSVCANSTSIFSTPNNTGRTFVWAITGGSITSGQGTSSVTVNWGAAGSGILVVSDSVNATGCKTITSPYSVTINSIPAPVISGSNSVCANSTSVYSTLSNTGRTYVWTVTGGSIASGQGTASITINWGGAGSGTLVVSDSVNTTGCKTITSPYSVTINANPAPIISGSNSVCANSIFVYSTPSNTGRTYVWTITGGSITSGQGTTSVIVNWGGAGNGTLTVSDSVIATGCKTITSPYSVTINTNPTPVISGSNNVCANSTSVYTTPSNTGRTYFWIVTGGTITSGQWTTNLTVNWGVAGSGTLVVSDSVNTTGCKTITSPYSVTINANPTPVISGSISVCANSTSIYSTPNNTGRIYVWTVTGGSIISGQGTANVTVIWGGAGSGTLVVSDSVNTTGCKTITSPYSVTINANPAPVITGSNSVCANSTSVYSTPNNTGRTYAWNITGGSITSGQGTASVTVNWGVAGSGTLVVSDSVNTTGCKTVTSPYSVTVNANPTPAISGSNSVCANSIFVYTTPNDTGRAYVWSVTGGTITSGQGTASVNINWGSAGSGTLIVLDSNKVTGCKTVSSTDSVFIQANPTPFITGKNSVCTGTQEVYNTPSNAGRSLTWVLTKGVIVSGAGSASVIIKWTAQGAGQITVKDSNLVTGCHTTSAPLYVDINDTPIVVITGPSQACELSSGIYSIPNNTGHSYNWALINGTILSGQNTNSINASWLNGTAGTVSLTDSINLTGCAAFGSVPVILLAKPSASFTSTQSQGKLTLIPILTGLTYKWKFGDGDSSVIESPVHTYVTNGTYIVSLHIQSSNGCSGDSSKNIVINTVGLQSIMEGNFEMSAYPNPFQGKTMILFNLHESANINLEVFDVAGRLVTSFVKNEDYKPGKFEFTFDADKLQTANSVYIVRLKVNDTVRFLRIVEGDRY